MPYSSMPNQFVYLKVVIIIILQEPHKQTILAKTLTDYEFSGHGVWFIMFQDSEAGHDRFNNNYSN